MIKKHLDKNIDVNFEGLEEKLEYVQRALNEASASISNIRYMLWLKEKIENNDIK